MVSTLLLVFALASLLPGRHCAAAKRTKSPTPTATATATYSTTRTTLSVQAVLVAYLTKLQTTVADPYRADRTMYASTMSVCATGNTSTCPASAKTAGQCNSATTLCTVMMFDCVGFVRYLLRYALNPHFGTDRWLIAINAGVGTFFPTAAKLTDFFASQPTTAVGGASFMQVARVADAMAGDIFAAKYTSTSSSNGHIMVAMAVPTIHSNNGTHTVYKVFIMDSTGTSHGVPDTRKTGNCVATCGLGTGYVFFLTVNVVGAPIAFYWSNPAWPPVSAVVSLSIGRVL